MKYFSVGMDYMYNGLFVNNALTRTTGAQHSLAVLGTLKLPMAVSKAFPNGRVFPYVSAGPSLNFTSLANNNATNIGFVFEPGLKFKVTQKVDVSAAYRMNFTNVNLNTNATTKFQSTNNMALVRLTYNF
jgi:opacity protein-like surface antigen